MNKVPIISWFVLISIKVLSIRIGFSNKSKNKIANEVFDGVKYHYPAYVVYIYIYIYIF